MIGNNVTFVGDLEACNENGYVINEVLDIASQTNFSWWEAWIASGIIASILLKTGVANFGIALLRMADPLMACDGLFIGACIMTS